jgi:hypothetical protein
VSCGTNTAVGRHKVRLSLSHVVNMNLLKPRWFQYRVTEKTVKAIWGCNVKGCGEVMTEWKVADGTKNILKQVKDHLDTHGYNVFKTTVSSQNDDKQSVDDDQARRLFMKAVLNSQLP